MALAGTMVIVLRLHVASGAPQNTAREQFHHLYLSLNVHLTNWTDTTHIPLPTMDITAFLASKRETLLIADHATYRAQLSRQILAIRKRLGRTTPKREKFARKPLTAADVQSNVEFVHLQLLIA